MISKRYQLIVLTTLRFQLKHITTKHPEIKHEIEQYKYSQL